ncbi:MAG: hypothetical protein ACTSSJ_02125 [Candidatus Odinarchaeia archaeon]
MAQFTYSDIEEFLRRTNKILGFRTSIIADTKGLIIAGDSEEGV